MAYALATIRANLKTLLQTVTEISYVYDYNNANPEGYPAIIFDITENQSDMLTDTENIRTITFTAYILCEIGTAGLTTAKGILDTATQQVVTALEKITNMTLSGSVDWVMPTVGARNEFTTPEGSVLSQELKIQAKVASSIL